MLWNLTKKPKTERNFNMSYSFSKGKTSLISIGLLAHCFMCDLLLGAFYFSYGLSHGYSPYLVLSVVISLVNVLPIIILSAKHLIPKISTIISFASNAVFCGLILYEIFSLYNFGFDHDLDNLPFLITIIVTSAIVILGSLVAMIANLKKLRK